jgi:hypothetical protein
MASGDRDCSAGLDIAEGLEVLGEGWLTVAGDTGDGLCSSKVAVVLELGSTGKRHSNGSETGRKEASP